MTIYDTVFPADSLEFCPINGFHDLFVCGTYKLEDQASEHQQVKLEDEDAATKIPQKRRGQCLVFRTLDSTTETSFQHMQSFDLPAILDLKWSYRSGTTPLLGIADSEGSVTLHQWQESEQSLEQVDAIRCASSETLVLSIDWANRRSQESGLGSLIASLSNGSLCILNHREGGSLAVTQIWHAHDYEPWVAAWNYWDKNLIYSGGDDLKLKAWDIRQGFDKPTFVNKRFDAGVTSIQNHPRVEHLLAVGSYNNTVKLFDTRKLSIPITEADVGGGAWRVKWHPSETRKPDLLVASMHDGFKVVRFGSSTTESDSFSGESEIINRNDSHESMAYGADWSHGPPLANGSTLVGGCSFYDHKMSLWSA